jgi:hypothetical protein
MFLFSGAEEPPRQVNDWLRAKCYIVLCCTGCIHLFSGAKEPLSQIKVNSCVQSVMLYYVRHMTCHANTCSPPLLLLLLPFAIVASRRLALFLNNLQSAAAFMASSRRPPVLVCSSTCCVCHVHCGFPMHCPPKSTTLQHLCAYSDRR